MMLQEAIVPQVSDTAEHPRPQARRGSWYDLQGEWEIREDPEDKGRKEKWHETRNAWEATIHVPCAPEFDDAGEVASGKILWYRRSFEWKEEIKELLIHFEAVDAEADVWLNGVRLGGHSGGFTPFTLPAGEALQHGRNDLVVRVEDTTSVDQPLGKQSWKGKNFLCWYTPTTGIWQPVWMEAVQTTYAADWHITPDINTGRFSLHTTLAGVTEPVYVEAELTFQGEWITTAGIWLRPDKTEGTIELEADTDSADFRVYTWSPEAPHLYDIELRVVDADRRPLDELTMYAGMRDIRVENGRVLLNRETFYQQLILDQGYYPGRGMSGTAEQMEKDLHYVKEMGFNGVRRHQTIADRRYLSMCDRLGLVVWAEMPSAYRFSRKAAANLLDGAREMVEKHYNHPSVIVYTLMNESWGIPEVYENGAQQALVNALYYQTKALDTTRLVVGNDGWEHTLTDLLTIHDYTSDAGRMKAGYEIEEELLHGAPSLTSRRQNYASGWKHRGEPLLISEFGGVAFGGAEDEWGYGIRPQTKEAAWERIASLIRTVQDTPLVQGFCYTQLADVEQEGNGLLDHDHQPKFSIEAVRSVLNRRKNGFVFD
ncbi:glycoside hydrolase family 2 protein [Alkalicoccus urumqiensis]|uniref:Glycoside hydrolase family 2 n=1 Tax=Alkalicoccus urumqiensis TaxID=1548213 RepID=A0A2P6MJT3_ALKUR|nr:glycoside hydrolase family 2 TIM barrel-domain containing protein [Alkalicoccus urumqiensis]PRO66531.1 glycoside hydrolase family 2 [Alkalicoccus urumqiensis]